MESNFFEFILRTIPFYYTMHSTVSFSRLEKNNKNIDAKGSSISNQQNGIDGTNILPDNLAENGKSVQVLKQIIFSDPTKITNHTLNEIIDAFANIGMPDPLLLSRIEDDSLTRLLVMFNKWINIDTGQEEIFSNMTKADEEKMLRVNLANPDKMLSYAEFIPERIYAGNFRGESNIFRNSNSSSYDSTENEPTEGLYNRVEKNKMEKSDDEQSRY